jgi:hypothetical protein
MCTLACPPSSATSMATASLQECEQVKEQAGNVGVCVLK